MGKGRSPCCDKTKVKSGPWSPSEDLKLISFIQNHGHANWRALPAQAGLLRCGKSCRLRWINYLRPDLRRGNITPEEEEMIIKLHETYGNKWSKIASFLPGRTDNEIKNIWNTHIIKKLGIKCGRSRIPKRKKSQDLVESTSMSFVSYDKKNDQFDKTNMNISDIKVRGSQGFEATQKEDENEQGESPTPSSISCLSNVLNSKEHVHGQIDFSTTVEFIDVNGSEVMDEELAFLTTHDFGDLDLWNSLDLDSLSAIDQCVENEDKAPGTSEGFVSSELGTKEPNTSNVEPSSWVRLLEIELGLDA